MKELTTESTEKYFEYAEKCSEHSKRPDTSFYARGFLCVLCGLQFFEPEV